MTKETTIRWLAKLTGLPLEEVREDEERRAARARIINSTGACIGMIRDSLLAAGLGAGNEEWDFCDGEFAAWRNLVRQKGRDEGDLAAARMIYEVVRERTMLGDREDPVATGRKRFAKIMAVPGLAEMQREMRQVIEGERVVATRDAAEAEVKNILGEE